MTYTSEAVQGEAIIESPASDIPTEAPASDVPAAPVDASSSIGAPALQPGEWVVEGSEKVIVEGESAGGVQAQTASASEVIYDSAEASSDAVPATPSEEAAPAEETSEQ